MQRAVLTANDVVIFISDRAMINLPMRMRFKLNKTGQRYLRLEVVNTMPPCALGCDFQFIVHIAVVLATRAPK